MGSNLPKLGPFLKTVCFNARRAAGQFNGRTGFKSKWICPYSGVLMRNYSLCSRAGPNRRKNANGVTWEGLAIVQPETEVYVHRDLLRRSCLIHFFSHAINDCQVRQEIILCQVHHAVDRSLHTEAPGHPTPTVKSEFSGIC
jgi:hypothetical protein